jgi:mycothiol synthase
MKQRYLHRMELRKERWEAPAPAGIAIVPYQAERHHDEIPEIYARSFAEPPWPADWDGFPEFDPGGVFVAESPGAAETVGYIISFQRKNVGYISVLAVIPAFRRRGIGTALAHRAVLYLRSKGLGAIQVDAFADSTPAVGFYTNLGFRVIRTYQDDNT